MKWMLFLSLSFYSFSSFAVNTDVPQELDKAYVASLQQLSARLTECQKSEKAIDISSLIKQGYEKMVIRKVVAYFYAKAKYECSQRAYKEYLVLSQAYSSFLPVGGSEEKEQLDALVSSYEKYRWRAIQDYSVLPVAVREYAESLADFKKPFALSNVIDQLNEI